MAVTHRTACDRCALVTSISSATVCVLSGDPMTGALTPVAGTGILNGRAGVAFLALTHGPFDEADGRTSGSQGACKGFPRR